MTSIVPNKVTLLIELTIDDISKLIAGEKVKLNSLSCDFTRLGILKDGREIDIEIILIDSFQRERNINHNTKGPLS